MSNGVQETTHPTTGLVRAERGLPPLEDDEELLYAANAVLQRSRTPALLRWRMALAERAL